MARSTEKDITCQADIKEKTIFFANSFLERYKIRHFSSHGAEYGGFIVYKRKNALKTAEMSGKRTKIGQFPYRNQNSIAEIVTTMESFLASCTDLDVDTKQFDKL